MIARGDLGIEVPDAKVPMIQKELIDNCLDIGKPVIVATQMLDSMIENSKPTRAEVSDVANAVLDGTDAVMLSGETAFGKYPVETVKMMSSIILETENSPYNPNKAGEVTGDIGNKDLVYAVSDSVFDLAQKSKAKYVVPATQSGFTARMVARFRPGVPIMVMATKEQVARHLALTWGVYTNIIKNCKTFDELLDVSVDKLKENKLIKKDDKIVFVAGQPILHTQNMNLVKLHIVE